MVDRPRTTTGSRRRAGLLRSSDDGISFRVSIPAVGLSSRVSQRSLVNILLPIGLIVAIEWMLYDAAMPSDTDYEKFESIAILFGLILLPILIILAIRLYFYLQAMFVRHEINLDRIHLKIERFIGDREIFSQVLFVGSIETITVARSHRLDVNRAISISLSNSNRRSEVKPFGHLLDRDEKCWLVRELMERVSDRRSKNSIDQGYTKIM
jgi:hypothetical protein